MQSASLRSLLLGSSKPGCWPLEYAKLPQMNPTCSMQQEVVITSSTSFSLAISSWEPTHCHLSTNDNTCFVLLSTSLISDTLRVSLASPQDLWSVLVLLTAAKRKQSKFEKQYNPVFYVNSLYSLVLEQLVPINTKGQPLTLTLKLLYLFFDQVKKISNWF